MRQFTQFRDAESLSAFGPIPDELDIGFQQAFPQNALANHTP